MNNQTKELIIFSGNANKGLSDAICKELLKDLGDADVGTLVMEKLV